MRSRASNRRRRRAATRDDELDPPFAHVVTRRRLMAAHDRSRPARAEFAPSTRAGTESRHHFGPIVDQWGLGRLRPDAELVLSELVANAVAYGSGPVTVVLERGPSGTLRIEVASDAGITTPSVGRPGPGDARGRGLGIVEAVSDRWGFVGADDTVCVWAELGRQQ